MTTAQNRYEWVDYAKGLGILLVVLGHVMRGLINASVLEETAFIQKLDHWIYTFHMPLFFFLSGLFASGAMKRSFSQLLSDKLRTIAYPYFVWSLLQSSFQIVLGRFTNKSLAVWDLVAILYEPVMQFWFLYTLFLVFLLVYGGKKAKLTDWMLLIGSLLLYMGAQVVSDVPWGMAYAVVNYLPYFLVGSIVAGAVHRWIHLATTVQTIGFAMAGFGVVTLFSAQQVWFGAWIKPLVAVCGIIGIIGTANLLLRLTNLHVIRFFGVISLEIYVTHTLASAGARIVLQKMIGVDNASIHFISGMVVGVAAPCALVWICNKAKFRYAFVFPKKTSRTT